MREIVVHVSEPAALVLAGSMLLALASLLRRLVPGTR